MTAITQANGRSFDAHVQVLIIGAGACGLVAALAAQHHGADVLVLEQDKVPAGSTALSSGFIPAAGTRFQAALGIDDSPEQFARDIQAKAGGLANNNLVRLATAHAGPALEWLADNCGLEWIVIDDFLYPGHSRHRMHAVPERTGAALMGRLVTAVEAAQIPIVTGAKATGLFVDSKRVCGVSVLRAGGSRETIGCDALVLACSGYGGNPELIRRYIPEMSDALYFGHSGNRGDALVWARELGAATADLTGYQGHGSVATPHGILISWALMMKGGIQVNIEGRRFANEHHGYSEQAVFVLQQPEGVAWNIYDEPIHRAGLAFDDYRQAVSAGAVKSGCDLTELCDVAGLPSAVMRETLGDIEKFCAARKADPFGRDFSSGQPLEPPYYAVRVTGAMFHTQGGVLIDSSARVIDAKDRALGNLYAGGGAACGVSGPHAEGYLSGNGLLTAVAFGALAGKSSAM